MTFVTLGAIRCSSFSLCGYPTREVESYHDLWKSLQRKKFQMLIVSENNFQRVALKTSHLYPDLTLVVLTLNHDPDDHKKLKIRGSYGVLTVAEIKAILQGLHKL